MGWRTWEEINRTRRNDRAIDDFGWPCMEGPGGRGLRRARSAALRGLYGDGDVVALEFAYRHDQTLDDERCLTERGSSISGMGFAPDDGLPARGPRGAVLRRCRELHLDDADQRPRVARSRGDHVVPPDAGTGRDRVRSCTARYVDLYGGAIRRIGYSATNRLPQAAVTATPPGRRAADRDADGGIVRPRRR